MTEHMKFYSFEQTNPEKKRNVKTKNSMDFGKLLKYNCRFNGLLFAVIGFLLGGASITANLFPCGIGWLAAMAVWDKKRLAFQTLPVLLGTLFWTGSPLVYSAILLLLMVFLGLYTPPQKMVRYLLPLIVFSTTLAVRGLSLFFIGISDLLLIHIFVESLAGAALSLVFLASLEALQRFTVMDKATWEEILCIFLLVTAVVLGLTRIVIFSLPLSEIAMRILVLIAALLGGAGAGAAVGTLMGMVPFLSGGSAATTL